MVKTRINNNGNNAASTLSYEQAMAYFLDLSRGKGLSGHTIVYYEQRLRLAATYLESHYPGIGVVSTKTEHIRAYIAHLQGNVSASTVNHSITALSAFFNILEVEEMIEHNPMKSRIKKVRAARKLIQAFSDEQIHSLLGVLDVGRFSGLRDHCLILLILDTGLRISEALGISIDDDIDIVTGVIVVTDKGNKQRIVPFGKSIRKTLLNYIARRGEAPTDKLFINEYGEPLTVDHIDKNMRSYDLRLKRTLTVTRNAYIYFDIFRAQTLFRTAIARVVSVFV